MSANNGVEPANTNDLLAGRVESIDVEGWVRLRDVVNPANAVTLAQRCLEYLSRFGVLAESQVDEMRRIGDKPFAGTLRLVNLRDRVPEVADLIGHDSVTTLVAAILGPAASCTEVVFRCPTPGFGAQKLHADDVPLTDCAITQGLTAIMPLVAFTQNNGSTRVVPGSHRRPDLQRLGGKIDSHPDEINLLGEPGDLFVFSRHLLHSGTGNRSERARPALQVSWSK